MPEPNQYASLRMLFAGERRVVIMPFGQVSQYLRLKDGKVPKASQVMEFIKRMDQASMHSLTQSGVDVFHCVQKCGETLFTPLGHVVASCVANGKQTLGVRMSCGLVEPHALANVKVLAAPIVTLNEKNPQGLGRQLKLFLQALSRFESHLESQQQSIPPMCSCCVALKLAPCIYMKRGLDGTCCVALRLYT